MLVPIRVGMIPDIAGKTLSLNTCPHTRGDDPLKLGYGGTKEDLSPYAWG